MIKLSIARKKDLLHYIAANNAESRTYINRITKNMTDFKELQNFKQYWTILTRPVNEFGESIILRYYDLDKNKYRVHELLTFIFKETKSTYFNELYKTFDQFLEANKTLNSPSKNIIKAVLSDKRFYERDYYLTKGFFSLSNMLDIQDKEEVYSRIKGMKLSLNANQYRDYLSSFTPENFIPKEETINDTEQINKDKVDIPITYVEKLPSIHKEIIFSFSEYFSREANRQFGIIQPKQIKSLFQSCEPLLNKEFIDTGIPIRVSTIYNVNKSYSLQIMFKYFYNTELDAEVVNNFHLMNIKLKSVMEPFLKEVLEEVILKNNNEITHNNYYELLLPILKKHIVNYDYKLLNDKILNSISDNNNLNTKHKNKI